MYTILEGNLRHLLLSTAPQRRRPSKKKISISLDRSRTYKLIIQTMKSSVRCLLSKVVISYLPFYIITATSDTFSQPAPRKIQPSEKILYLPGVVHNIYDKSKKTTESMGCSLASGELQMYTRRQPQTPSYRQRFVAPRRQPQTPSSNQRFVAPACGEPQMYIRRQPQTPSYNQRFVAPRRQPQTPSSNQRFAAPPFLEED